MAQKKEKFNDAVFIVTSERECPYYDFGDQIKIDGNSLVISGFKPACLYLSNQLRVITTSQTGAKAFPHLGNKQNIPGKQKTKYDCGGCSGLIKFEYVQAKGYVTLQMKLLKQSEEQRKRKHLEKFYLAMRNMEVFEPLEDDALQDLVLFLEFQTIPRDKVLIKRGSSGTHLYIILKGQVAVVDEHNSKISEIQSGEILGELSLLSGDPENNSFHTAENTQVAMLSVKNFKKILKRYPTLQIFLFKLLIERVQAVALRSGNIASGMTGELQEVPAVDLMQLINSSQKTGSVQIQFNKSNAQVYFSEGEIIHATCQSLKGKEALYAVLNIKRGSFSYKRGIPDSLKGLPPLGGFIGLLMEGVQRIDEAKQS